MSLEERFLMMTGNNKVWRAPVAGLASVAMLATVGVSALTANAADVEFTFEGNGLTFNDGKSEFTVEDSNDNGKLDSSEIQLATSALDDPHGAFTGWYTTDQYGLSDKAVQPGETTNTTVYAHWSETRYQVTFDGNGVNLTEPTDDNTVTLAYKDGVLDKVASWQVPTDGDYNDHHMLTGWTSAQTGAAVKPDDDLSGILPHSGTTIALKAASKDSTYVTFRAHDKWGETERYVTLNGKTEDVNIETPLNEPFQGTVPTAAFVYADKTVAATQFVKDTDKKVVFNASDVVTENTNREWFPATPGAESYTVKFFTGNAEAGYSDAPETQMVEKGNKVSKPADPTLKDSDSYKYEFAGWYDTTSGKEYDFNTPVSGNLNLQAYFKVSEMKVTFDPVSAGSKVIEQWYGDGDAFKAPAAPERDGYVFDGWFAPTDGTKLTLESEPENAPQGKLTYIVSDGEDGVYSATLGSLYEAYWTPESEAGEKLGTLEGYVDVNSAETQDLYTAASYEQYVADFQDYLAKKAELAKGGYTKAEYSELLQMLNGIQSKLVEVGHTNLYRVYNPNNGDHYFTTDPGEYKALVAMGWQAEGVRYQVVKVGGKRTHAFGTGIWSVYNPNTGEHLLTEEGEADALAQVGWIKEGTEPKFYTVQNGSESVVRVYNPNTNGPAHLYTDASEANGLAKIGWSIDNNGAPVFTLD